MTGTKLTAMLAAISLFYVALAVEPAYAQIAIGGGGGAGLLSQVIQWFITNIAQGLIMIAVVFAGVLLMFARHSLAGVALMVIGAIVISQYATIAGFFNIG